MFRLTLVTLFCISLLSCQKKHYGGFQKSTRETFSTKTNGTNLLLTSENPIFIEDLSPEPKEIEASTDTELRIETLPSEIKNYHRINKKLENTSKIETTQTEVELPHLDKTTENQEVKSLKRNPVFNDSLKVGLVFLIIAAALAFVPALLQLAVLFAVVAMVFLFIGLKKLFNRRAKIKKKKERKENNQMRKEKVKEMFKK
ncbi:hypothetical protein EGI26_03975 [Lacihabitans sp. CCS-44]|uniref:phage holin family protein n=1 Tax=Lacihabitans sp. CCS-44 TaxID=2487331 RepID=UPI0020CCC0FE|nr:phage holin family protein [Lacihabitans sp. CCS-44]MCP9754322.1 hypothetical protein [Lacihabitans sp. CCS-44]